MTRTRQIVNTRYGQVHAQLQSGTGVPLVLLHDTPRSAAMWRPVQELLARPSIAIDRLGYGFSDPPPWALSMEQFADSVLDALKSLGYGDLYDLLGCNAGALEAIEVASRAVQAPRALGLLGLPWLDATERAQLLARAGEGALPPAEDGSHLQSAWRGRFAYRKPPYDLAAAQERLLDYLLAPNPAGMARAIGAYAPEKRLRALKMPVIVFAPRDEQYESTRRAAELNLPALHFIDLPDIGYDPCHTAPQRIAALIDQHLPS